MSWNYQIDAFSSEVFGGNPAAVCTLESWLSDDLLQSIAAENNLAETAYFVRSGDHYELRWFTPTMEVDLCGHATLASAFVITECIGGTSDRMEFDTKSGRVQVLKEGARFSLIFPSRPAQAVEAPELLLRGVGATPSATLKARDYMVVLEDENAVRNVAPDLDALAKLDALGTITVPDGAGTG